MSASESDYEKYVKDTRIPCKYGAKCYQKNPVHQNKYKHPPKQKENTTKHSVKKLKVEKKIENRKGVVIQVDSSSDSNDSDADSKTSGQNVPSNTQNSSLSESDVSEKDFYETSEKNEILESSEDDDDKNEPCHKHKNDVSESESSDNQNGKVEVNKKREIVSDSDDSEVENGRYKESKVNAAAPAAESTTANSVLAKAESSATAKEDPELSNYKKFIRETFLVDMPDNFYQFWSFCTKLKPSNPLEALRDVGLTLVGPFDVLAGRFRNVKKSADEYLVHWRYYRDPPEFQTVLKGDNKTAYHIGYFRDSPDETPVFMASYNAKKDGILTQMGENIFAAVNLYLDDLKKSGDPFKKLHISRIQSALRQEAEKCKMDMSPKTNSMVAREKKMVTRTFNKIGLVVPYDRKSEVGYRPLAVSDKELRNLLTKLQNCLPEQREKILAELQPVFTYASIAADECDFGTGIELGWDIISHGVESLNNTARVFLTTNYRLLHREAFSKIADAHMSTRKKGCDLSII